MPARNPHRPTIGSLFSGYGGLDLAVEHVFNARTVWQCEWEDAPSAILARHWPNVPNHRDVTAVDWAELPPVDIITGGFPCQDVSLAGRRAGMTEGTRSNLWGAMRTAIETIRPTYVVAENVRGLLSAKADSACNLESEPGLLGGGGRVALRGLGRVLGDLADLGYDAQWHGLRASDIGAPHHRFRVFILATRRDATDPSGSRGGGWGTVPGARPGGEPDAATHGADSRHGGTRADVGLVEGGTDAGTQDPNLAARGERRESAPGQAEGRGARADAGRRGGAPAPDAAGGGRDRGPDGQGGRRGPGIRGETRSQSAHRGGTPAPADADDRLHVVDRRGVAGTTTSGEWSNQDADRGSADRGGRSATDWGPYAAAVHRWEPIVGRRAPAPTVLANRGKHRLSPRFTEFMMGLPDGWITDTPGIKRNQALKMCGNGVVPQQAEAALTHMLTRNGDPT